MKNIKLSCIRLTYMCYILLICDKKQMNHQIPSEEDFYYYGIVRFESRRMVIGPTRQVPDTDQNLRRLAFRLGLSDRNEIEELIGGIRSPVSATVPIETNRVGSS